MKTIITFILGVLFTISLTVVASQTNTITIFKPATPRQVMVKEYWSDNYKQQIVGEVNNGWIVKDLSVAVQGSSFTLKVVVIYEKY